MKFKLSLSGYFYPDEKERTKLEKLGFRFAKSDTQEKNSKYYWFIDSDFEPEIEINSLEELIKFQKKIRYSIILNKHTIEIYDDYRE